MSAALPHSVQIAFIAIGVLLVVASLISMTLQRLKPERDYTELRQRIKTWWLIVAVFAVAVLFNRTVSVVVLGFVSFLAFKEYLSLIPTRRADHRVLFWAYLAIPVQFYWVWMGWYGLFIIFIPVYVFLFLPMRMILIGQTQGFLHAIGTLHWGLMITVFSLSHTAFMLVLPPEHNPAGGAMGLLIYLVFLTEFNDVAQYIWGKSFGRRKIVPKVSPNKTIAGFLGGVITTMVLAVVLAPWLTPLTQLESIGAGILIGIAGFVGDVTISALKRDLGVKDSGSLLPGHGGLLDRLDSLTYTAPLFFHYAYFLHY
ncbi:putative membrane associated CTP-phosphosubstrate transferase [Crenothrix polyspora]|jgi:phosphatidate cytidylyltransferase|uniref:Phosphatidate cytidylyltransferase n=1 Tax=Crenothrix polyspora TaxID=360316 RepID=A0A1R4H4R4_9GAMM|nr:phosphatidate cytidylyltransferase [Crenothrix polyspora]SJM91021.1 putative membrane associated CTP-phosphosubstrate transferase [Crenothrix polyspora]